MKFAGILIILCILIVTFISPTYAHPGRTASDGCHYCRTNCDSWGEAYGERHCHGGGPVIEERPVYVYPTNTPYPTRIPTRIPTATPTSTPPPTITATPTPTEIPVTVVERTEEENVSNVQSAAGTQKKGFWDYFFESLFAHIYPRLF